MLRNGSFTKHFVEFLLSAPVSEPDRDGLSLYGAGLLVADLVDHVQDGLRDVALAPEPDGVGHVTALQERVEDGRGGEVGVAEDDMRCFFGLAKQGKVRNEGFILQEKIREMGGEEDTEF